MIKLDININNTPDICYKKFTKEIGNWWPKAYTWSQEKLIAMEINARKDGLCTETGPFGFRCDWGRVILASADQELILN
ncbi:hypothetical protein [Saccharicrinis sp. FJH54]|uniref:hypothetical protein n=1 Tax=Saccharicrinis sp. FJH54 TaxID=3344665 RepID=UPI0035D4ED50